MIYCAYSMPLPETVETYKYFITEAEKLDLAYITLVRYASASDVEIDGQCFFHSFLTKAGTHLLVFLQRQITRNPTRRPRNIPSVRQKCQTIP